jgi:2-polyprenyl-3-methyl-5-hydroxy-6-metoxy-1,4-benzoquinol methylase
MTVDDQKVLEILREQGFLKPEKWIKYARLHNFKKVRSEKLNYCPDCNSREYKKVGQYIYYSNLINLMACKKCNLIFSDTRIDTKIIQNHFENTYKNEMYFSKSRKKIFNQIANLVDYYTPIRGRVIDIGGGKGHLLAIIKRHRPDLMLVLNDISISACEYAANYFNVDTICGPMNDLYQKTNVRYDLILLIDSLYYEPNIYKF